MRRIGSALVLLCSVAVAYRPAGAIGPATPPPGVAVSASPAAAPHRGDANTALLRGSQDVVIKSSRYYDTNDGSADTEGQQILVVTFEFTNDTGIEITPRIDHFEFVDPSTQVSTGIDSGYAALIGVSNPVVSLKVGDKKTYTIGFLVPANDYGQIIYDTSI